MQKYLNSVKLAGVVSNIKESDINKELKFYNLSLCIEEVFKNALEIPVINTTWVQVRAVTNIDIKKGDFVELEGKLEAVRYITDQNVEVVTSCVKTNNIKVIKDESNS